MTPRSSGCGRQAWTRVFLGIPPAINYVDPWLSSFDERFRQLTAQPRRIAYFYEYPDTSTFRYRAFNPGLTLAANPDPGVSAAWFDHRDLNADDSFIDAAHALVICRARYNARVAYMVARGAIPVLFDSDDLVFDVGNAHLVVDSLNLDQSNEAVWDYWFSYMGRIGAVCAFATLSSRPMRIWPSAPWSINRDYAQRLSQTISIRSSRNCRCAAIAQSRTPAGRAMDASTSAISADRQVTPAISPLLRRQSAGCSRVIHASSCGSQDFWIPIRNLELYPDVAAAVGSGAIKSGAEHYLRYGIREERLITKGAARSKPLQFPFPTGCWPTRRDRLLTKLDLRNMSGLEIGALASPLVKPSEGSIFFVDHADTQEIRSKYAKDKSVNPEIIVAVDAIWGEKTLQQCIGHDKRVDYVLASHVVEHVPDLVTWLAEIHEVLKNDGSLRLAVPDRRYTFDYLRNKSRLSDVLEAYLLKARRPLPRFVIEHCHMAKVVDIASAWRGNLDARELQPMGSVASGIEVAKTQS